MLTIGLAASREGSWMDEGQWEKIDFNWATSVHFITYLRRTNFKVYMEG